MRWPANCDQQLLQRSRNPSGRLFFDRQDQNSSVDPPRAGSLELVKRNGSERVGQPIDDSEASSVDTPMITLDSLALPRCDLIKIDVEGMELSVLEGATRTINQHHPILHAETLKIDKGQFMSRMASFGYDRFDIGQNCLVLHRSDPSLSHVEPRHQS